MLTSEIIEAAEVVRLSVEALNVWLFTLEEVRRDVDESVGGGVYRRASKARAAGVEVVYVRALSAFSIASDVLFGFVGSHDAVERDLTSYHAPTKESVTVGCWSRLVVWGERAGCLVPPCRYFVFLCMPATSSGLPL